MGPQSITGISPEQFIEKIRDTRVILLYPWTTYRNVFLSYVVNASENNLIYTRITDGSHTLAEFLKQLIEDLSEDYGGFGNSLNESLSNDDPIGWGVALAEEVNQISQSNTPQWLFIDEVDRIPHDEKPADICRGTCRQSSPRFTLNHQFKTPEISTLVQLCFKWSGNCFRN